jgi:hypothetical protein
MKFYIGIQCLKFERKIRNLPTKHKTVLPAALKHKLNPYYSKPLHLHGLPIQKPDTPLRPVDSSIGQYRLLCEYHRTLYKINTGDQHLQNEDCHVSFDVCIFTNISVEEVLQVIRNRFSMDPSFLECTP